MAVYNLGNNGTARKLLKAARRDTLARNWPREVEELRSWVPENVSRIVPLAVLTMLGRGEVFRVL